MPPTTVPETQPNDTLSTQQTPENLEKALTPIKANLDAATERMLASLIDPVAKRVVYLITAGGKRLRPALVLLAGTMGNSPDSQALIDTAAAVELIHTATLIHDDIIDQSPLRRWQPTFHQRWGTERALLMGDYLYATAFALIARLKQPVVMATLADVCQQLCRGELHEVEARFRLDLTEEEYLDIVRDKTASLLGGCCACGAQLAGCPPQVTQQFTTFGIKLGVAFQIIDDCLDLSGDQTQLGKLTHADLDKGALSLPIIYLTQTLSRSDRDALFAPLRDAHSESDANFLARVAQAASAAGCIEKAQARAKSITREALDALADIPLNGMRDVYAQLAAYALSRRG